MFNPVVGRVSSEWSKRRRNPATGRYSSHAGIDIAAPVGTPIRAAFGGKVLEVRTNSYNGDPHLWKGLKSGNFVVIQNTDNAVQWYGHMEDVHVRAGDTVTEGETIGTVGQTGTVTGPHAHFETWSKNVIASHFNPRILFNRYNIKPGVDNKGGTPAKGNKYTTVSYGSINKTVGKVQVALQKQGYNKQTKDNRFFAQTDANIRDFQKRVGLVIDGIAGEITQKRLGI